MNSFERKLLQFFDWSVSGSVVVIVGIKTNWWLAAAALLTFGWLRLLAWSIGKR